MATPGAEFSTLRRKISTPPRSLSPAETELETGIQDLEKKIASHRDIPLPDLLKEVADRTRFLTGADGAAIAISDRWGVTCRASAGQAPETGSRLRPDSALTRECFETAQIVICEDTETDYRVRRSTAKSLSLRSAVVVPLQMRSLVLGVIEVLSSRPSAFRATQIAGLQRIAERLADAVFAEGVSAEPDKPPSEDVASAASVPARELQQQVREETVLVPFPAVALPGERKHGLKTVLLCVAALLLLPLMYFALVRTLVRTRQQQAPSIRPPLLLQRRALQLSPDSLSLRLPLSRSTRRLLSLLCTQRFPRARQSLCPAPFRSQPRNRALSWQKTRKLKVRRLEAIGRFCPGW